MSIRNGSTLSLSEQTFMHKLWCNQTATVTRFMLRGYIKSGWVLFDIVFIWFLYAAFFFEFGGDVTYFYGVTGPGLGVLAVLGTILMHRRAMQASMYQPLARLKSRTAYIFGVIMATIVLRVLSFILMLLLGMSYHAHVPGIGIQGATLANMVPGAIGALLYNILLSVLTVFLLAPTATRLIQILFLAWVVALLFSSANLSPLISYFFIIVHIPLIPISSCYNFGVTKTIDAYGSIMILLMLCYIAGLFWLCAYCFKQRDLIMH